MEGNCGVCIEEEVVPRFDCDDISGYIGHLKKFGYAVIRDVASREEIATFIDLLWQIIEDDSEMRRDAPHTWGNENFKEIGCPSNGIVGYGKFNHSEFMWRIRLLPKVKKAFASIYRGDDDLITSFDGGNIFRPWHAQNIDSKEHNENFKWKTSGSWWHVDQGRDLRGFHCVQGLVTLTDANARTGSFCVIPGSHLDHDALMAESEGQPRVNFVSVPQDSPTLREKKKIIPIMQAGDLMLWDSRTIHCNSPAIKNPDSSHHRLLRVSAYVCMVPRMLASRQVLAKRKDLYGKLKNYIPN